MKNCLIFFIGVILSFNQVNGNELKTEQVQKKVVISVGSTNPLKVQAVKNVFSNEEVIVIPCTVSSNIPSQPLSDEETLQGAVIRAKESLEKTEAEMGIGLEAGVFYFQDNVYLCHWGALYTSKGQVYFTNSPIILLPSSFQENLLSGLSLEKIMHKTTGIENLGKKEGAIGIFTNNQVNREEVLTQMVKVLVGQYQYYNSNNG